MSETFQELVKRVGEVESELRAVSRYLESARETGLEIGFEFQVRMPIKSAVGDVPEGARVLAKRLQQYMSSDRSFVEAAIATVHHEMQMEAREHAQQLLPAFNAYRESVGLDPVEVPILREPPPLDDEPSLSADSQPQGENDASNPTRDTQAAMQAGGGGGNRRPRNPRS